MTLVVVSLIQAQSTSGFNSSYFDSLAFDKELGATRGIDAALQAHQLDALVLPAPGLLTTTPAGTAPSIVRAFSFVVSY